MYALVVGAKGPKLKDSTSPIRRRPIHNPRRVDAGNPGRRPLHLRRLSAE